MYVIRIRRLKFNVNSRITKRTEAGGEYLVTTQHSTVNKAWPVNIAVLSFFDSCLQ